MTGDPVPMELVKLVRSIQDECWPLPENKAPAYSPPGFLFRNDVQHHPIPFFGNPINAEVVTIAVNPSSTEFAPWRNWGSERLPAGTLASRLVGYFRSTKPKPHPWFAEIEEALNVIGCSYTSNAVHLDLSPRATRSMRSFLRPGKRRDFLTMLKNDVKWLAQIFALIQKPKLVMLIGSVIDERDPRGVGIGDFLSRYASDLWNGILAGLRWPQKSCSKALLADRVFRNRGTLLRALAL
jgi:hypothetical protein